MKVAITGSTGMIGSRIVELLQNEIEFIPLSSKEIDITNKDSVFSSLKNTEFDLLLHFAAYTNVDKAEEEKELAYKLNVEGTRNLVEYSMSKNAKFIYISTGFVFDGKSPPYFEQSLPRPLGYYGQTKFEGEEIVKNHGMIVRLEYPYGISPSPKKDIVKTIKSLLEQNKKVQMVQDSKMTPTYIDDLAGALKFLINNYSPEIFHIVGADSLSPFELGKTIAKTYDLDEDLVEATTFETYFEGKAPRPQWAEVKSEKNTFYPMKTFEEGLLTMK